MLDLPKHPTPHSRRRRRSFAEKIAIVQESLEPNVSIAAVALAHRINANQLHKWRWEYRNGKFDSVRNLTPLVPVQLLESPLPVPLTVNSCSDTEPGYVEILTGESRVWVHGNVQANALRAIFAALGS